MVADHFLQILSHPPRELTSIRNKKTLTLGAVPKPFYVQSNHHHCSWVCPRVCSPAEFSTSLVRAPHWRRAPRLGEAGSRLFRRGLGEAGSRERGCEDPGIARVEAIVILSRAIAGAGWRYANPGWVRGMQSFSTCCWVIVLARLC